MRANYKLSHNIITRVAPLNSAAIFIYFILLSFIPLHAYSQRNEIIFGSEVQEGYVNSDKTGLYVDILKAVYEPSGYTVKIKLMPFKRFSQEVNKGLIDGAIGTYAAKHLKDIPNQSQIITPYYPIDTEIVVVSCNKNTGGWEKVKAEDQGLYAWVRGYHFQHIFGIKESILLVNHIQALKMLSSKRLDCIINPLDYYLIALKNLNLSRDLFTEYILSTRNLYIGFELSPTTLHYSSIYDKRIKLMLEDGSLEKIYQHWGKDFTKVKFNTPEYY